MSSRRTLMETRRSNLVEQIRIHFHFCLGWTRYEKQERVTERERAMARKQFANHQKGTTAREFHSRRNCLSTSHPTIDGFIHEYSNLQQFSHCPGHGCYRDAYIRNGNVRTRKYRIRTLRLLLLTSTKKVHGFFFLFLFFRFFVFNRKQFLDQWSPEGVRYQCQVL